MNPIKHLLKKLKCEGGWVQAAIAGAAALGGGIMANQSNSAQADRNNNFQAKMSDTAYQRAVADMKAAGLNPMLAYGQGGASSPSGTPAQMQNVIGPAVGSALEARRVQKEIEATESINKVNDAAAAEKYEAAKLSKAMQATQATQQLQNISNAKVADAQIQRMNAEMPALKAEVDARTKQATQDSKFSDYDNLMKRANMGINATQGVVDIINPLRGLGKILKLPGELGKAKDGTTFNKGTGEIIDSPKTFNEKLKDYKVNVLKKNHKYPY